MVCFFQSDQSSSNIKESEMKTDIKNNVQPEKESVASKRGIRLYIRLDRKYISTKTRLPNIFS